MNKNIDRAGKEYWEDNWKDAYTPPLYNLDSRTLKNWVDHAYLDIFDRAIKNFSIQSVMEIGCGNSIWLAYLARLRNLSVSGLDYTDIGCKTAEKILAQNNVSGKIHKGDLFDAPTALRDQSDLVFSNGVVEHFDDTASCVVGCASFAKPDGFVLTFVPNMSGLVGILQKYIDRNIYDVHVPLDLKDLQTAHTKAGLEIVDSGYFVSFNLYTVNISRHQQKIWHPLLRAAAGIPTRMIWWLETKGIKIPANRFTSPYIFVLAQKKAPV